MRYKKGQVPFNLNEASVSTVNAYKQVHGKKPEGLSKLKAYMVNALKSNKMVLKENLKALHPYPTAGLIMPRTHKINVTGHGVLELHPDFWDAYLAKGIIDEEGNYIGIKKAQVSNAVNKAVEEAAAEMSASAESETPVVEAPAIESSATEQEEAPAVESPEISEEADPGNQTETETESEEAQDEQATEESAG